MGMIFSFLRHVVNHVTSCVSFLAFAVRFLGAKFEVGLAIVPGLTSPLSSSLHLIYPALIPHFAVTFSLPYWVFCFYCFFCCYYT